MTPKFVIKRSSPMSDLPDWLQALIVGIGGLGAGGYTVSRMFKRDNKTDFVDDRGQRLIDTLSEQLEKERAHTSHLGLVIDRLSAERNAAVQAMGELKGQLMMMSSQIESLTKEIEKQERINSTLNVNVKELREEVMSMANRRPE